MTRRGPRPRPHPPPVPSFWRPVGSLSAHGFSITGYKTIKCLRSCSNRLRLATQMKGQRTQATTKYIYVALSVPPIRPQLNAALRRKVPHHPAVVKTSVGTFRETIRAPEALAAGIPHDTCEPVTFQDMALSR